jgi:hypothetical protein
MQMSRVLPAAILAATLIAGHPAVAVGSASSDRTRASAAGDREPAAATAPRAAVRLPDAYWSRFAGDPALSSVRPVFEGDFRDQKGSVRFKGTYYLFADLWSRRCAAQVRSFRTFEVSFQTVTRTRQYLDGRVENEYGTRTAIVKIDERFGPQWDKYELDANKLMMSRVTAISRDMGGLSKASNAKIKEALQKASQGSMIATFFSDHACTSAEMTQLRENLLRAEYGKPSLQADYAKPLGAGSVK